MMRVTQFSKPKLKGFILLEGLPGIGSVGKIAVDFMIDHFSASKFLEVSSDGFPHSVFVNEEGLIDSPKVEFYYKIINKIPYVFISGDVQPIDERACAEFCNFILDFFEKNNGKEIITIGGIGLPRIPKSPSVYYSGTDKKILRRYNSKRIKKDLFGTVGPILGVTGLLAGFARDRRIPAVVFLAQTFAHPSYMGIAGAKEVLGILAEKLKLKINLKALERESKKMEKEILLKKKMDKKYPEATKSMGKSTGYIG